MFIVGGTNGKGSTCALLEAVLLAAGKRVGRIHSRRTCCATTNVPHRWARRQRRGAGSGLCRGRTGAGRHAAHHFEHGTLAAWVAFCRRPRRDHPRGGAGRPLDAVNVFEPDCAIVTSVAMDHMDYLGDTSEAIGREKAGIFRPGVRHLQRSVPPQSLIAHAEAIGDLWKRSRFRLCRAIRTSVFWMAGGSRRGGWPIRRCAAPTSCSMAAVMAACEAVRFILPVPMQAIRQGFMLVELPGRFQVMPGRPAVVSICATIPRRPACSTRTWRAWAFPGNLGSARHAGRQGRGGRRRLLRDRSITGWPPALSARHRGPSGGDPREVGVNGDIAEFFAGSAEAVSGSRGRG